MVKSKSQLTMHFSEFGKTEGGREWTVSIIPIDYVTNFNLLSHSESETPFDLIFNSEILEKIARIPVQILRIPRDPKM